MMETYLLVGSYTERDAPGLKKENRLGKGLSLYAFTEKGLGAQLDLAPMKNPSFAAVLGRHVFAVSETEDRASVYSFLLEGGRLRFSDRIEMPGAASCHVTARERQQDLIVSNYESGTADLIRFDRAGKLCHASSISFYGRGLHLSRQEKSHIHSSLSLPDGSILLSDLGADRIERYTAEGGKLRKAGTIFARPGDGPRHMALLGNRLAVINELSASVALYELPFLEKEAGFSARRESGFPKEGNLLCKEENPDPPQKKDAYGRELSRLFISDRDFGENLPAGLVPLQDGRLLASNRGDDTLCVISADGKTLSIEKRFSAGGSGPRCIDAGKETIWAADQGSDRIAAFGADFKLRGTFPHPSPVFVKEISYE